ncbi:MAG: YcaO-like family protein, partial [Gemmatimonadota bacterium]
RRRLSAPVVLTNRPKRFTGEGGHRAQAPAAVIEQLAPLVDPLTGVVSDLERVTDNAAALRVYTAGLNLARPAIDVAGLRYALRRHTGGKGLSDEQARASALGEAVERYCGLFHGDEVSVHASMMELGDAAIGPNESLLYSDAQLRRRSTEHRSRDFIPARFDPTQPGDWTAVWSLTAGCHRYLPTGLLFYGYHTDMRSAATIADSNGNAAGASLEDAVVQGFLELVERDGAALWWYNRVRRAGIAVDPSHTELQEVVAAYHALQREVWLLDLSTDFGIPIIAAVSRRVVGPSEQILLGLGAHFDAAIAAGRALTEMNQMLVASQVVMRDPDLDPVLARWLADAKVGDHPYLWPNEGPTLPLGSGSVGVHDDLLDDIQLCRRLVERRGLEFLVLDQTRPDIAVPVVKVIVPGLRHFRPRFAPGRLYDVPVRQGWLQKPHNEQSLNPIPFFL